jgi:broad specificity phosphatase PhoE
MSQILFIRHGPTEWNQDGRIQGHTDVPLSTAGRDQVASWRLPPGFLGFDWISSPLTRARQTARLLGVPNCAMDDRLREANWGDWEGRNLKDLRVELGEALTKNERRGLDLQVPNGESPRMVRDRLSEWLAEAAQARRPLVAVCHNGVLRAAYSLASGWDMRSDSPLSRKHAAAHLYHLSAEGGLRIKQLNIHMDDLDRQDGYE